MKKLKKIPKLANYPTSKELKVDIQKLVRQIVMLRDDGCILRHYPESGACGGYRNDGNLILQAEHLITRSNSATYGDTRTIVCLCLRHHGYFKPQHSKLYWDIIERHLGSKKWKLLEKMMADHSPHKVDWRLTKIALEQELKKTKRDPSPDPWN